VLPNEKLSLQLHNQRVEHWIVVSGEATVTVDDKISILSVDQSTYIPNRTKHRLENNTDKELIIIEVQIGDYLEENDIERFEDIYGRV
jgi:mannose-6-phosphate isomerase-like protein (cupin superfamily)